MIPTTPTIRHCGFTRKDNGTVSTAAPPVSFPGGIEEIPEVVITHDLEHYDVWGTEVLEKGSP